ncbi:MAG: carboxypeptidase regulatory-like domain-containing protein [Chloroflexi bacterium]|nr:carboxypeptidase regulatory-like domain-containing protein [Chloroflexota bacterium]
MRGIRPILQGGTRRARPIIVPGLLFLLAFSLLGLFVACTGPEGTQGSKGDPGPQGLQGVKGDVGPAGTSVGTIEGKIVALATGKGVEKAAVITNPATTSATTDVDGKFKLESVPTGAYTLVASAAGYNAASLKLSVLAGKSAAANLSLNAGEPFAMASVRGVSFRTGDTDVYAGGKLWLTTHYTLKGDAPTHNENRNVTSSLPNVGVGTYVYLQGRETDAAEKKITAWAWKVVGPGESEVKVEDATSRTPRFLADRVGKYEVTVTTTSEEAKKASSSLEVYAGTYVGAATCTACHSGSVKEDAYSKWAATGHATKLITTFPSYTPERDYCIGCHTTGYNETDKANGFDDLAKQAGWDPAKISLTGWLIENKWTVDKIMTSDLGKLANVQCESCHGPGLIHEGIITAKETGAIFQPGVCSQCHPQEAQWRLSGHANTGSAEIHMAEGTSCVECHTGQGYVEIKIRGNKPIFPNMATAEAPATLVEPSQQPPVACAACHDPHLFNDPFNKAAAGAAPNIASLQLRAGERDVTLPAGATVKPALSATCVLCHANKRDVAYKNDYAAGKKTRGVHDNSQADVFYGVGVFDYGKKFTNSAHPAVVKEACIECHMAASPAVEPGADGKMGTTDDVKATGIGGHTWNVAGTYKDKEVQNLGACTTCHKDLTTFNRPAFGDFDADGKIEGVQDEVKGLLDLLGNALPQDATTKDVLATGITDKNTNEAQRKALWNYWLIRNDGSNGVHNTRFAVDVLTETYKQLTGKEVGK